MLKKIIFFLLIIGLMAFPCSAWEMTFENCGTDAGDPADVINNLDGNPGVVLVNNNNWVYVCDTTLTIGSAAHGTCSDPIKINHGFNDRFAFTGYGSQTDSRVRMTLDVYLCDANGNRLTNYLSFGNIQADTNHHRFEIVNNGLNGVNLYKDGVLVNSYSFSNWANVAMVEIAPNSAINSGINLASPLYVDDIVMDQDYIIGCKDRVVVGDSLLYWTYGVPAYINYKYTAILKNEANDELLNWTLCTGTGITSNGLRSVDLSLYCVDGGTYTLYLYGQDTSSPGLPVYYLYSKDFTYDAPAQNFIDLSQYDVSAGESVIVYSHMDSFVEGSYIEYIESTTDNTNGVTKKHYLEGTQGQNCNDLYELNMPDNAVSGATNIRLYNNEGTLLDSIWLTINGGVYTVPIVYLDKIKYDKTDPVKISYGGAAKENGVLVLQLRQGSVVLYTYTWEVSGGGSKTVYLGAYACDNLLAQLKDGSVIKDSAEAEVLSGEYTLQGRVYDSVTGAAVEDATIAVGTGSDITDSQGNYLIEALIGRNTVEINCAGYNDYIGTVNVFELITKKNFWIAPLKDGNSLYGVVTSYKTGYPVEDVRIVVKNSTYSRTALTDEKGYYEFDPLANGTYTVTASKANYDTKVETVSVAGGTYLPFRIVAVEGYKEKGADPGSTTGEVPTEVDDTDYSAQPYGAMGRHPFDFNGDGDASADEWKYAFERLIILVGCLCFMGFLGIVGRAGRR